MIFDKNAKNMNAIDIGLLKLTVVAIVLFIITIWPALMDLVHSVNPWYFLVAAILFGAKPAYGFFKPKNNGAEETKKPITKTDDKESNKASEDVAKA